MKAEYKNHMGSDLDVVNNARVSFDKESDWDYCYSGESTMLSTFTNEDDYVRAKIKEGWTLDSYTPNAIGYKFKRLKDKDKNLIQYLARGMTKAEWSQQMGNVVSDILDTKYKDAESTIEDLMNMSKHWAPFAHEHIKLKMQAPYPIRTQAFKHKIGFIESEESRRYISSTPELFIPEFRMRTTDKKQGSGAIHPENESWKTYYKQECNRQIEIYIEAVACGICEEQARFFLPLGCEVNWIWTGSLVAFARFYNQRHDTHAQKEIQDLAEEVGNIISPLYPVSWEALTKQPFIPELHEYEVATTDKDIQMAIEGFITQIG